MFLQRGNRRREKNQQLLSKISFSRYKNCQHKEIVPVVYAAISKTPPGNVFFTVGMFIWNHVFRGLYKAGSVSKFRVVFLVNFLEHMTLYTTNCFIKLFNFHFPHNPFEGSKTSCTLYNKPHHKNKKNNRKNTYGNRSYYKKNG